MFGDNLSESEGELNGIVEYENHIVLLSSSIYKITVSNLSWKTNTKILFSLALKNSDTKIIILPNSTKILQILTGNVSTH